MTALRIEVPDKMLPFITERRRHKVARGGRGSGKSWSIARLLVGRAVSQRTRWLCAREVQKSIKESSHRLLADQIAAMDLGTLFDVQRDVIKGPHGSEFAFAGLQDHTADSIKSYEGFDGCWVEEAHAVSERSANVLIPTIRTPGSEIWWSYNPDQTDDYVHQLAAHPDTLTVTINWRDNPWFPSELDGERLKLKALNEDLYRHVWEGECRSVAGLLFKRNWFHRYAVGSHPERLNAYMASDYAGGPDPDDPDADPDWTEHGVAGLADNGHLWFTDWWSGQEDPSIWIRQWIALARKHKPLVAFEEKGPILRAVDGAMRKAMAESGVYAYRNALASAGNKAARALGFAARAAEGTVWIPECPWGDRLVEQLCAFNGQDGRTDDMVDVCSLLARGLDLMANARPPANDKPDPIKPFTRRHIESIDRDEREEAEQRRRFYR